MSEQKVTLKQLNLLRLSRDAIQKWYKDPAFNSVLRGLYCRVVVRDTSAQKYYRVGLVECIRVSDTPSPDGCSNVIVEVAYGKQRKSYALDFVSNGAFLAEEAEQYFEAVQRDGTHMLTFPEVEEKLRAMKEFVARCRGTEGDAAPPAAAKREPLQAPVPEKRAAAVEEREEITLEKDYVPKKAAEAPARPDATKGVRSRKERHGEDDEPQEHQRRLEQQQRLERENMEWKGEVQELKTEVAGLTGEVTGLKGEAHELKGEVRDLKGEVGDLKGEVETLEAALAEERDAQKKHKMKVKEMDILITSQAELIKALQTQLANEREMLSSVAEKRHLIATEYKELKEKCVAEATLG